MVSPCLEAEYTVRFQDQHARSGGWSVEAINREIDRLLVDKQVDAGAVNLDLTVAERNVAAGEQRVYESRSRLLPQIDIGAAGILARKRIVASSQREFWLPTFSLPGTGCGHVSAHRGRIEAASHPATDGQPARESRNAY